MIITDLLEYVGKDVKVIFEDGRIMEGILLYIPAYSEIHNWRRPKHFYIKFEDKESDGFRSYHVKSCEERKQNAAI